MRLMNQFLITVICWAALATALLAGFIWLRATDRRNGRR